MRTNIELDDVLVKQAIKLSKLKTKREVVQEALRNYVAAMKKRIAESERPDFMGGQFKGYA